MVYKRHWDNFFKINGFIKQGKKLIFIVVKFISGQRDCVQYYLETVKHLAFISEEQAYCQGYVDCVQLLAGLGMLRDFPDIKELVEKIQN